MIDSNLACRAAAVFLLVTLLSGCSSARHGTQPGPAETSGKRPTFTPAAAVAMLAAVDGSLLANQAATLTALPTATPQVPTSTPTAPPTLTATPTHTPTPSVLAEVRTEEAKVREGPSVSYPKLGELSSGRTMTVTGRNRRGDWWRVCCIDGGEAWISAAMVEVTGPLWIVTEVNDIAPPPPPPPTRAPPPTPAPTPTQAWPFRLEYGPFRYPQGADYFMVAGAIYDGVTPLWGYKLRIRNLTTGQEWLTEGSEAYWKIEPTVWVEGRDQPSGVKRNVKWDSSEAAVRLDDGEWDVTCVDGGGGSLSAPVRIPTSRSTPLWYYVVFTNRK